MGDRDGNTVCFSPSVQLCFSMHTCLCVLRLKVNLHNILPVYTAFLLHTNNSLPPQAVFHTSHTLMLQYSSIRKRDVKLNTAGSLLAVGTWRRKSGGLWELEEIYVSSSVQSVFVVQCLTGDCACASARVCLQQCKCPPLTQATTNLLWTLGDTLGSNYCTVSVYKVEVNNGVKKEILWKRDGYKKDMDQHQVRWYIEVWRFVCIRGHAGLFGFFARKSQYWTLLYMFNLQTIYFYMEMIDKWFYYIKVHLIRMKRENHQSSSQILKWNVQYLK